VKAVNVESPDRLETRERGERLFSPRRDAPNDLAGVSGAFQRLLRNAHYARRSHVECGFERSTAPVAAFGLLSFAVPPLRTR